jgi:hypothetical protein
MILYKGVDYFMVINCFKLHNVKDSTKTFNKLLVFDPFESSLDFEQIYWQKLDSQVSFLEKY